MRSSATPHGGLPNVECRSRPSFAPTTESTSPSEELADALDPPTYLGSAEAFVDRALELYRSETS